MAKRNRWPAVVFGASLALMFAVPMALTLRTTNTAFGQQRVGDGGALVHVLGPGVAVYQPEHVIAAGHSSPSWDERFAAGIVALWVDPVTGGTASCRVAFSAPGWLSGDRLAFVHGAAVVDVGGGLELRYVMDGSLWRAALVAGGAAVSERVARIDMFNESWAVYDGDRDRWWVGGMSSTDSSNAWCDVVLLLDGDGRELARASLETDPTMSELVSGTGELWLLEMDRAWRVHESGSGLVAVAARLPTDTGRPRLLTAFNAAGDARPAFQCGRTGLLMVGGEVVDLGIAAGSSAVLAGAWVADGKVRLATGRDGGVIEAPVAAVTGADADGSGSWVDVPVLGERPSGLRARILFHHGEEPWLMDDSGAVYRYVFEPGGVRYEATGLVLPAEVRTRYEPAGAGG